MGVFRDKIKKIPFVTKVYRNISGADKREIMALLKENLAAQEENRKLVEKVISQQKLIKEKLAQSETIREDVINKVTDLNRETETKIAKLVKNAEQNLTKSVDKVWKNYYAELVRCDYWKVKPEEIKRMAGDRKIWIIKCPAPDSNAKAGWGDFYFANSLAKNLEKLGIYPVVDLYEDWSCELMADCVIVLRGLKKYHPDRRNAKCRYIMWNISHPDNISKDEYELYDAVCIGSKYYADRLKEELSVPVYPLEQCTDTDLFYPEASDKKHDYIFVGNSRGVPRECVMWSVDMRLPIEIWGGGWEPFLGKDCPNVAGINVPNDRLPDLYRTSYATINDHWDDMLKYQFINNRIFDSVACGLPVITDYCEDLYKIFGDNILYYRNEEEFRQCILKLEDNYPEIKKNTLSMWDMIKKEYSFEARAKQLLDIVKNN